MRDQLVQKELDDLGHGERMLKHQQRSSQEVRASKQELRVSS